MPLHCPQSDYRPGNPGAVINRRSCTSQKNSSHKSSRTPPHVVQWISGAASMVKSASPLQALLQASTSPRPRVQPYAVDLFQCHSGSHTCHCSAQARRLSYKVRAKPVRSLEVQHRKRGSHQVCRADHPQATELSCAIWRFHHRTVHSELGTEEGRMGCEHRPGDPYPRY